MEQTELVILNHKLLNLIKETCGVALDLNTSTEYACFIRGQAHVDSVEFELALSKKEYTTKIACEQFHTGGWRLDEKDWIENQIERLNSFKNYLLELISNPLTEYYKATFDFGVSKITKNFQSEEARLDWLVETQANASCKLPEPILETIKTQRQEKFTYAN